jgi:predicted aspartyl protease
MPAFIASPKKRNSAILPDRVFFIRSKLDMQQFCNFKRKALWWATFLLGLTSLSAPASEIPTGVSLSRTTGNHLFVPVRINNRPGWFAVDTGAALTIVDSSRANSLGVSGEAKVVELPRQIEVNDRVVRVAHIGNLQVGNEDLGAGPVALIDLRAFSAKFRDSGDKVPMDGILGLDILERYRAVIDCAQRRIYLQSASANSGDLLRRLSAHRLHRVPLRITNSGALEVEGHIGSQLYSFVVDTGGFATLIPTKVATQAGITLVGTTANAKGIHSKERPVSVAIAPQLEIGKFNLGSVVVGVTVLPEGPEDLTYPFGGLLGADFFFERNGIIDVGNRYLYFK